MNEPIIHVHGVEKIYGYGRNELRVLRGIDLTIVKGEVVSIVGPSGAGKSTLLNIIGCLDSFQKGRVAVLGKDISNLSVEDLSGFRNRHIGFIFQLHNLLPEFNAVENVMMPLLIRRQSRKKSRDQAMDLLQRFNLEERSHHIPGELSGGECQRLAVARAIVGSPDIILADEPTGSLDTANSMMLTETLLDLGHENGTTIIIVTHDRELASMTERTISLIDGTIQQ